MDRWLKTGNLKNTCDDSYLPLTNDKQIEHVKDNGLIENSDNNLLANSDLIVPTVAQSVIPINVVLNENMTRVTWASGLLGQVLKLFVSYALVLFVSYAKNSYTIVLLCLPK